MDDFLDRYHLLKVNQDQVTYLNSPITHKEIEAFIKTHLPKTKQYSPGADSFWEEPYTTFKEELISILLQIETEGTLPHSFYEATVILIPKPHKDSTENKTAHAGQNA